MTNQQDKQDVAGVDTEAATPTIHPAKILLNAIWPSDEHIHQLAFRDKTTGQFWNVPVTDVDAAVEIAATKSAAGIDVYFATAGYLTGANRLASNVAGSYAFHIDIDCGEDKAATGNGYRNFDIARAAVRTFCVDAGLPAPTHSVLSGTGLHCYWALDKELPCMEWQALAKKLKRITKAHNFRADGSRTSDIASVLRVPGTFNYKRAEPAPVELLERSEAAIDTVTMAGAIKSEYARLTSLFATIDATAEQNYINGAKATAEVAVQHVTKSSPSDTNDPFIEAPNFPQLESALKSLEPDCDEFTWTFHRLAPMANTAAAIPEIADRLYQLARNWSSGDLRGIPAKKWVTPGGNGLTGAQYFDRLWNRFLKGNYNGKKATLATIFWHAKQAGWTWNYLDATDGDGEEFA